MKFASGKSYSPQDKDNFGDSLTFPLAPSSGQNVNLLQRPTGFFKSTTTLQLPSFYVPITCTMMMSNCADWSVITANTAKWCSAITHFIKSNTRHSRDITRKK